MAWVLIVLIANTSSIDANFDTERACKAAGKEITKHIGDTAVFWCFPKTQ